MAASPRLSPRSVEILRCIARGHSYAQIVEHCVGCTYTDIFAAAEEAVALSEAAPPRPVRTMGPTVEFPKAYAPWTPDADRRLLARAAEGASIHVLAVEFGRKPSAIRSRLGHLSWDALSGGRAE
ncbi:MAG: hypothetical protein ACK5XO_08275 [Phycisphaerales bacterium]|jgi:hypothetical protein